MQPAILTALANPVGIRTRTPTITWTPTETHTPTATATATLTPTSIFPTRVRTATPAPSVTATSSTPKPKPSETAPPTSTPRPVVQHFLVGRPVAPNAKMIFPDPTYLYGTTEKGDLDVHHGEEFENPIGTSLYAVADGTVVTAGSDMQRICGNDGKGMCGPYITAGKGFYGNLVVIRLAQDYNGVPVFALYGHMNKVFVTAGTAVKKGDLIGEIGMSGIALGPHVHFEIRLGVNDYSHTRNPILWMTPLPGHGSLAGRYTDTEGNLIRGALVDIYRTDNTFLFETETYGRDRWPAVNSDDQLKENFAIGDLPAGDYVVRIAGQPFAVRVSIERGKLSLVEIGGS
ncbi:MAG: peptidoglycan DD-metalloendopeptidase family protein [Chloroflexi bacterium]|nr:peptidoglycan DD-metalloendopeptidase family protein [Chloroflexota bacterium]